MLLLMGVLATDAHAQGKYTMDNGEIRFRSNAPLELIQAASSKVTGTLDPATNQFAFLVPVPSFTGFNSDLQRQHFNENYLESAKYPRASFTGKIIEQINYEVDSSYVVRAKGELDIHGQKQTRIIRSRLSVKKGVVQIDSEFLVPLADHNIAIPKIVSQKIATEIEVTFKGILNRK